jgi:inosine/xanthosine triphosphatase
MASPATGSDTPVSPTPSPIAVAVGSTNPVKVNSVQRAFERFFPGALITVTGYATSSGVADQPMSDDETRRGAGNRAFAAASACKGSPADFAVGLEGGCEDRDLTVGLAESLRLGEAPKHLECFAWMAVLQISTGVVGWARTGSFVLPPAVASLVRSGVELGVADDRVFGRSNSKQQDGAVGLLTRGIVTRTDYYEHALLLALVPFGLSVLYSSEAAARADRSSSKE